MPQNIQEITDITTRTASAIITDLRRKANRVPIWGGKHGLASEYDPKQHPVMDKNIYPDTVQPSGEIERVTRITYNLQQLAVKRMAELCCGIPVRRIYQPENDRQKQVAAIMEKIYRRNRIDTVNNERLTCLFAGCEVLTLWYAVEEHHNRYGFNSPLKFRCRNYSPMSGDRIWPLYDHTGDLVALSIEYTRDGITYFDAYTATEHFKWQTAEDNAAEWTLTEHDNITAVGKIPAVYAWRPTPIWEDTSKIVAEMEWAMSRNGNYLRKNSKPLFCVFADQEISYGEEKGELGEFRSVLQYPKGSTAGYITWPQAVDNLKFHITELRQSFFTQLQLPDWSYESMKGTPMSGESRKQLFIDAQLKVKDESGRILEMLDRETNVVKAFLKVAMGQAWTDDIDALPVESVITPFTITEDKDTINNLMAANGGEPLMSQRESIERYGQSQDVDKTMEEIAAQKMQDALNLSE